MFDVDNKGGTLQAVATIPEFPWELSLGIYCTIKDSGRRRRSSKPARVRIAWKYPRRHPFSGAD